MYAIVLGKALYRRPMYIQLTIAHAIKLKT